MIIMKNIPPEKAIQLLYHRSSNWYHSSIIKIVIQYITNELRKHLSQ